MKVLKLKISLKASNRWSCRTPDSAKNASSKCLTELDIVMSARNALESSTIIAFGSEGVLAN